MSDKEYLTKVELAREALGTPLSEAALAARLELPEDYDVNAALADMEIERCPECDWWVECGELVDEDCEVGPCSSCRSYADEDEDEG